MSKNIKQIYVGLELCEGQIRILVSEYFNTRFNVIRAERYPTNAITDFKVYNKEELVEDIRKAVSDCSDKLGTTIEKVILVLPAYNFKRHSLKSKVVTEDNVIRKEDIARATANALKANIDSDIMIVNEMANRYYVNGLPTRRMPEMEAGNELIVDLDLYCADRAMCFDYVSAVEEAGVNVLDIVLNNYAMAKEAVLFEESLNRNIIVLDVNRSYTYLTLLSKGRLISTEILFDGLNSIFNKVYRTYNLPYNDIPKLVKYSADYDSEYPDDTIYAYNSDNKTHVVTTAMLNEAIHAPLELLSNNLVSMCKPIIEAGASVVLTGEGQQMKALSKMLEEKCQCEFKEYYPEIIGIRDATFGALYGSFLIYRDKVYMNNLDVSCIDLLKYDELIDHKQIDQEGETITTKIKNLFKQYIDRGLE